MLHFSNCLGQLQFIFFAFRLQQLISKRYLRHNNVDVVDTFALLLDIH